MTPRYFGVTHISVSVADLRAAERYYRDLFDLQLAWRDTEDGTITEESWEQLETRGGKPIVSLLWRDDFRLALEREREARARAGGQIVGHIGLQVSVSQLRVVRDRALAQGLEVIAAREDELFDFRDRFGVEWELDTRDFGDPVALGREIAERRRRESRET